MSRGAAQAAGKWRSRQRSSAATGLPTVPLPGGDQPRISSTVLRVSNAVLRVSTPSSVCRR